MLKLLLDSSVYKNPTRNTSFCSRFMTELIVYIYVGLCQHKQYNVIIVLSL